MFVAIVLLVLVLGTVGFHFLSPWYFTPIASNWTSMDDTVTLTFVMTGLGFCIDQRVHCLLHHQIQKQRRQARGIRARECQDGDLAHRPDDSGDRRDAGSGPS